MPLPFDLFSSDDRREHRLLPLFAVEMHGGRRGRAQPRPRGLGRVRRQRTYRIIRSRLLPCFGIQSRLRKLVGALAMFPILLFWVLRYRAPVLHLGNFSPDILAGWPIARLMGRRLVVTILGEELTTVGGLWSVFRPLRVLGDWAAYWMLRHCAVVQTISGFTRSELLRRGIREDRIAVITPGIDLDKSRCDRPIAAEIAARLAGKRIVLTVGRFTARKGQDMTIRALPRVLSSHPDVVYVMAGSIVTRTARSAPV